MHELAVCQSLLAEAERVAAEHHSAMITRLLVAIGPLSGVEAPLLCRAFEIARMGSLAEAAHLEIERCPVIVWCDACGIESEVELNALICFKCGNWKVTLRTGDELLLKSIELEEAESVETTG